MSARSDAAQAVFAEASIKATDFFAAKIFAEIESIFSVREAIASELLFKSGCLDRCRRFF